MRRKDPECLDLPDTANLPAPPAVVLEALGPLLTEQRLERIEQVIAARSDAVVAVLDGLIDPHNVSAVLRSADAFGVRRVHLIDSNAPFLVSPRVSKGTDRWLQVTTHRSTLACVEALRARGHRIFVAAPAAEGSVSPEDLAREPRPAIVFGNEHAGVSPELQALADGTYTIPMRGFVQSLNVSVAAAITLFAAMQGRPGNLDAQAMEVLRARYYLLSVPQADAVVAEYLRRQSS